MNANEFLEYIEENFNISGEALRLIGNILDYAEIHIEPIEQYGYLCEMLEGTIGLSDREIRRISL